MRETAYYILFTSKKIGYINKRHTHTLSGAETSWFQFCLTITKPFPPIYLEEMQNYLSLSVSRTVYVSSQAHRCIQISSALQEKPQERTLTH